MPGWEDRRRIRLPNAEHRNEPTAVTKTYHTVCHDTINIAAADLAEKVHAGLVDVMHVQLRDGWGDAKAARGRSRRGCLLGRQLDFARVTACLSSVPCVTPGPTSTRDALRAVRERPEAERMVMVSIGSFPFSGAARAT